MVDWWLNHCHIWTTFMKLLSFRRFRVWCLTRFRWMQMTMYLGGSTADGTMYSQGLLVGADVQDLFGFNCVIRYEFTDCTYSRIQIISIHSMSTWLSSTDNIQMLVITIYNKKHEANHQFHCCCFHLFCKWTRHNWGDVGLGRPRQHFVASCWRCGKAQPLAAFLGRFTLPVHTNLPGLEDVFFAFIKAPAYGFCMVSKVFDGEISANSFLSVLLQVRGVCHFISGSERRSSKKTDHLKRPTDMSHVVGLVIFSMVIMYYYIAEMQAFCIVSLQLTHVLKHQTSFENQFQLLL